MWSGGLASLHALLLVTVRFHRGEFPAVMHEFSNECPLRVDGLALFDDEHGHEAVGDQEQDCEDWQPTMLFVVGSLHESYLSRFDGAK
jgi:hypothetical protein